MRKSSLLNLMEGTKIQHKRNGQVLTVIKVKDNEIVCEERTISVSNCTRWFDILVEEIPEPVQPIQPTIIEEKHEDDQLHDDTDTTVKNEVVEGDTATNSTGKTNTVQPTIQQRNLMADISNLVDLHGANLIQRKEYIGVYKEGYKGCIAMIRRAKYGGLHIDMKQKIWNALDEDYKKVVSKEHYTGIYDKSRKLFRIGYVSDLDILEVVICTALQIA